MFLPNRYPKIMIFFVVNSFLSPGKMFFLYFLFFFSKVSLILFSLCNKQVQTSIFSNFFFTNLHFSGVFHLSFPIESLVSQVVEL